MPSPPSSFATISRNRTVFSRKWTNKEYAIAFTSFSFTLILFSLTRRPNLQEPSRISSSNHLVPLTLLSNATQRGALCLDGSAPGYHFQKGFGSGYQNWLLHIEGGGWCESVASCYQRKMTALGSSKHMETEVPFSGILSSDPSQNPYFFNWNKVRIRYCDGASFAGHQESEIKDGNGLFFRGQIIWEAIMDELLSIGMSKAKQALLSGCSAGGLATLIHCDDFRKYFSKDINVKCLADAGFFLDEEDAIRNRTMRSFYHDVVQLQIQNILVPHGSDPHGYWKSCRLNIPNCNADQFDVLHGFRKSLLKRLNEFQQRKEIGMFINSCFIHCQTAMGETWHSHNSPKINDKTIAETVADWYFDRKVLKLIDCPYPCNPTCRNMDFTRK
ncbi:pectin acetylesterase 5 isoform X3 [Arachis ipaensis]|uniref:pectin acetylesterase 5 isoform X3 n=1 Tax=Arachis ipaensis TaxID=130454 RepID=UPI0007AF43A6|nr:pectin acetylesterase 5 isoform X3 [Arachis ipaensis]XP_025647895.1 pectin acetylesterase 5 isoform X4 [Arachis hypogaea]